MVSSSEPGLFIVPTMAVSPSSMLSRVTRPLIGATMVVLRSASRASESAACACATPKRAASCCASATCAPGAGLLDVLRRRSGCSPARAARPAAGRSGLEEVGAGLRRLRLRLGHRRLGAAHRRLVGRSGRCAAAGPRSTQSALLHRQLDHAAGDVGRDVDLALRLDCRWRSPPRPNRGARPPRCAPAFPSRRRRRPRPPPALRPRPPRRAPPASCSSWTWTLSLSVRGAVSGTV
jgi:hypothetical protein